jgi:hypothetical protein
MNETLTVFSIFIFLFGVILTVFTVDRQNKLSKKCTSVSVNTGLNLILMLSIMMMLIPIIHLYCYRWCKCDQNVKNMGKWYKIIIIIILTILVTSGSVVIDGLNETTCKSSDVKSYMVGIITISVILILISLIYMFLDVRFENLL